ncbi:MAG: glycosyltransferase [Eubacterium sp.]|nr:glycosyltransferase [Eubacterium sp.]
MKPKTSVVMAVYNGGQYIGEQIKSILEQTHPVDELILIDDCSPEKCINEIVSAVGAGHGDAADSTAEPVSSSRKEPGFSGNGDGIRTEELTWNSNGCIVRYLEHAEQKGYAQTFFDALSLATGDFIFFSDQDDIWEKNKAAVCLSVFKKHPEILCLSSCNRLIDGDGKVFGQDRRPRRPLSPIAAGDLILQKHGALRPGMTTVIRCSVKETIDKMDVSAFEMHDRLIEYLAATDGGYWLLGKYLSRYRIHDANTSGMNLSHTKLRTGLDGRIDQIDKEIRYLDQIYDLSPENNKTISRARDYFSTRKKLLKKKNIARYIVCSPCLFSRYSTKKIWLGDIAGILKG